MRDIETHSSLENFFEELLREAMAVERLDLEHESFVYVRSLFSEFASPDGLHSQQTDGERGTPALVSLYERAISAREPGQRFEAYRHLGDVSLFVSGMFTSHVQRERALVGIDYYVDMGASAYGSAAYLASKSGFSRLLDELARKFKALVDVLGRIAERTTLPVARDLRALYESILQNPDSSLMRERLLDLDVAPVFSLAEAKA